jgi:GTP cyclohydrolase I
VCRAAELVAARRKGCEALGSKFEAPLKEAVRHQSVVFATNATELCMLVQCHRHIAKPLPASQSGTA